MPTLMPTLNANTRARRLGTRRAYILLEALVGGALVAMVVGALYIQAGLSHGQIVGAARRTQAIHLAQVALERELAKGFFRATASGPETVVAGGSTYARTVSVSPEGTFGGVRFKDVVVEVAYKVNGDDKNQRASSRVWAP
jgi:hypothetical protein